MDIMLRCEIILQFACMLASDGCFFFMFRISNCENVSLCNVNSNY